MTTIERNVISGVLVAEAIYLRSPIVAVMPVVLYAVYAAEIVYGKFKKDKDVEELQTKMTAFEKRLELISMDVNNVAERAQTILGEGYR